MYGHASYLKVAVDNKDSTLLHSNVHIKTYLPPPPVPKSSPLSTGGGGMFGKLLEDDDDDEDE